MEIFDNLIMDKSLMLQYELVKTNDIYTYKYSLFNGEFTRKIKSEITAILEGIKNMLYC